MSDLESRAKEFATKAHERVGQKRKYTGEPYITHPASVVAIVKSVPHTEEMLAAAWLHDTVEDTGVLSQEIGKLFGPKVQELVGWLTDVSKPTDGNREVRKHLDLQHIAGAPADAQTVKLADLIDNSRSIMERDKNFAKVYLAEKRRLLLVLTRGDKTLHALAMKIVEENGTAFTSLAPSLGPHTVKKLRQIAAAGPDEELKRLFDILDKNPINPQKEELEAVEDINGVVWVVTKKGGRPIMLMAREVWDSFQGGAR